MPNLAEKQADFVYRLQYFAEVMAYFGVPIKFHSYFRSFAEQNSLYLKGATKAKAGQSAHNYGLAVDYHFDPQGWKVPEEWWRFGDMVARYAGLESGLAFKDANHIQMPGWKQWI